MTPFRLHDADGHPATPLPPGMTILEASAGTGKTFTLAGIVARLVLDEGLALERIAVLTFTEAATAELRERIRERIAGIERGDARDPFAAWLAARFAALDAAAQARWRQRLRAALASVDLARITTIHGFARRIGIEHAAALGLDAGAEPSTDLGPWRDQVVHDWIRRHLRGASPGVATMLGDAPEGVLQALAEQAERAPHAVVVEAALEPAAVEAELVRLRAAWPAVQARITAYLAANAALVSGASIFRPDRIAPRLANLGAWFDGRGLARKTLETTLELTDPDKQAKAFKGKQTADAAIFAPIAALAEARRGLADALKAGFIAHYRQVLAERPRTAGAGHVDDPLRALDAALADGGAIAEAIGTGCDAVLVDEFQDTDLRQWRILRACFTRPRHRLLLIGDPKQAIYRFRGADLHAYLAARDAVPAERRFTLAINHRSDRRLVEAINALYLGAGSVAPVKAPFALAEVEAHRIEAWHGDRFTPGTLAPEPLQVLALAASTSGEAVDATAEVVAAEIVRLLTPANGARISDADRPLRPRDIAVLVRTHRQGDRVALALAHRRVPSVRCDRASVFAGDMAPELADLLAGCLDPQREAAVRRAATTRLVGAPGTAFAGDDALLADLPRHLGELGEVLHQRGIAAWWYRALDRDLGWGTPRLRVSALADAPRHLADLHQLVELAAMAQAEQALPAAGVARWLAQRLADPETPPEAEQRRLERDDDAVRVVTVFAAKGLQYPVVFEAFAWTAVKADDRAGTLLHEGGALRWHLGDAVDAADEALGDDLRKLYVGLTRAERRCYLLWTALEPACRRSALALLLHARGEPAGDGLLERVELAAGAGGSLDWLHELGIGLTAIDGQPSEVAWKPPSDATAEIAGGAVLPPSVVRQAWFRSSFTGLARRIEDADDGRDHDAHAAAAAEDDGLEAGAAFGTAIHELYEHADFTAWAADHAGIATALAGRIAATPAALAAFAGKLQATVAVGVPGIGPALAALPSSAIAREWPVRLPLARRSPDLAGLFHGRVAQAPGWVDRLDGLHLAPGVFEGVIDAVVGAEGRWHVIDWKTNRLAAYDAAALWQAMAGHDYILQAHLYLVALHRWLRLRLGARYRVRDHLGCAAYAFVRGADPRRPGAGWCVLRPDPVLIEDLDACFGS